MFLRTGGKELGGPAVVAPMFAAVDAATGSLLMPTHLHVNWAAVYALLTCVSVIAYSVATGFVLSRIVGFAPIKFVIIIIIIIIISVIILVIAIFMMIITISPIIMFTLIIIIIINKTL